MNPAVRKGLAVVGVALLLLFPLAWLHSLVSERTALREQAIAAVARGWGGRQLLSGPLLAIPVTTTYGLLYLLVTSDDYALLAGALGLFAVLAVAMVVTREIDWYYEETSD